jgi:hypothetical protein
MEGDPIAIVRARPETFREVKDPSVDQAAVIGRHFFEILGKGTNISL